MNNLKKNKLLSQRHARRLYALCVCLAIAMTVAVMPAFAATAAPTAGGDPLSVVSWPH